MTVEEFKALIAEVVDKRLMNFPNALLNMALETVRR